MSENELSENTGSGKTQSEMENLLILYKGKADLRWVGEDGLNEVRVEFFCGIDTEKSAICPIILILDPDNLTAKDVWIMSIKSEDKNLINDPLLCYRIMRIFETLLTLPDAMDIAQLMAYCITWFDLCEDEKNEICDKFTLCPEEAGEIMRLIPPSLEEAISIAEKQGIKVSVKSIEGEVAAGRIERTPFMENLSVRLPEEIREEKKRLEEIVERNLAHVKNFIGENKKEEFGDIIDQFYWTARRQIVVAIGEGLKEDDLITGSALLKITCAFADELCRLKESLEGVTESILAISSVCEMMTSGRRVFVMSKTGSGFDTDEIIKKAKLECRKIVAEFLVEHFSAKRTLEEYLQILDGMSE